MPPARQVVKLLVSVWIDSETSTDHTACLLPPVSPRRPPSLGPAPARLPSFRAAEIAADALGLGTRPLLPLSLSPPPLPARRLPSPLLPAGRLRAPAARGRRTSRSRSFPACTAAACYLCPLPASCRPLPAAVRHFGQRLRTVSAREVSTLARGCCLSTWPRPGVARGWGCCHGTWPRRVTPPPPPEHPPCPP